ncbi:hypothetical protein [Sphingobacterium sp. UBA5670]|uniref:hypothetical protein n=1 Tax=Sphingobacterium sp. UBA5670 TaxID=1947502 RepID=UPI0025F61BD3|nr:hypothetical protein [Sphingobacterium sp. UBA5670]
MNGTPSKDLVEAYDKAGDTERKNANIWFYSVPWADEFWNPSADAVTVYSQPVLHYLSLAY